jgi:hypothetical protein
MTASFEDVRRRMLEGDTKTEPKSGPVSAPYASPVLKQPPYPGVFSKVFLEIGKIQVERWDRALRDLEKEQRTQLSRIVARAKATDFGKKHGFAAIKRWEDFARQVPIGDYDSFSPFIDRMRTGEKNVLVPGFVKYFGNSSGSSNQGKPKFLPVTDLQVHLQKRAAQDALFRFLVYKGRDDFMEGYTLGLFPSIKMREEGPVTITSNPALMAAKMPAITRWGYLPDMETRAITDYDAKMTRIAETCMDLDVRAVAGTTCWFSVLFQRVLDVARQRGRKVETVREIWPNLDLLLGGGVSADPYMPVIRSLLGRNDVSLIDTYNATEGGVYASSDFTGEPGLRMIPHRGTFFEFVALEDDGKPDAKRVPLWEVETNRPYVIVVTTVSGLYAYRLGDIVRFTSRWPHRMEFMGRLSGCLSLTQELTTHVEVERAAAAAFAELGVTPVDFGAAGAMPDAKSKTPFYVLFVELAGALDAAGEEKLARAFDAGLARENRVYREHREGSVAIGDPRVVLLPPGTAAKFLHGATGGNVQGKFPRILNRSRAEALFRLVRPDAPLPSFA